MSEQPILILTLRRTGGTDFTTALVKLSSFPAVEHEPFNRRRKLSAISESFAQHSDPERLRAEIDAALDQSPNIKHCVEVQPIAITRALIDVAQARGYYIIVLTRRNEAKRIGSLLLAQATGAWGPAGADRVYPRILDGTLRPAPIDLSRLANRVHADFAALGQTLTLLRNRGIDWDWIVFEEIYLSERSSAEQVAAIARRAGIQAMPDDPRLTVFAKSKGQNSAAIASYVPNFAEAMARLETLCAT